MLSSVFDKYKIISVSLILSLIMGVTGCGSTYEPDATVQSLDTLGEMPVENEEKLSEENLNDEKSLKEKPTEDNISNIDNPEEKLYEDTANTLNPDNDGADTPAGQSVYMVANDTANIRLSPSTEADILRKLSIGEKVELVSEQSDWYEVTVDGGNYFVFKDYLEKEDQIQEQTDPDE
ncbi:MAG: SH3 domain-containing protein [Lachnospiraceae bacterium]|nr:SH3 domain-containing protein [Lachnospiraceae bacterium]